MPHFDLSNCDFTVKRVKAHRRRGKGLHNCWEERVIELNNDLYYRSKNQHYSTKTLKILVSKQASPGLTVFIQLYCNCIYLRHRYAFQWIVGLQRFTAPLYYPVNLDGDQLQLYSQVAQAHSGFYYVCSFTLLEINFFIILRFCYGFYTFLGIFKVIS